MPTTNHAAVFVTPSLPKLPPPVVLFDYVGEEDQGKGEERIKAEWTITFFVLAVCWKI